MTNRPSKTRLEASAQEKLATPHKIAAALRRAKIAIAFERFCQVAQPFFSVTLVFLSLSWFGVWHVIPVWLHIALLLCFLAAVFVSAAQFLKFKLPNETEALARVERSSSNPHQAISVQSDKLPQQSNAMAEALFTEHKKRQLTKIEEISAGKPNANLAKRDPWALRTIPVFLVLIAFAFAQGSTLERLAKAFYFDHGINAQEALRTDIWLTPPKYTKLPPILLSAENSEVTAPQHSQLLVQIAGAKTNANLSLQTSSGRQVIEITAKREDNLAKIAPISLQTDTDIELTLGNKKLFSTSISIQPDAPPSISWKEVPAPLAGGTFSFSYSISDDFGIESAFALIEPTELTLDPSKALFEVPQLKLPISKSAAKSFVTKTSQNLIDHPLAGERVLISLFARDHAGQIAKSEPQEFRLPQRNLRDELARALVDTRQKLATDKFKSQRTFNVLDALTTAPEDYFENKKTALLAMNVVKRRVAQTPNDDQLRSAVELLWHTALGIEDGNMSLAAERLREAQKELSKALEEGADEQKIAQLMKELREAMNEFLETMQAQMQAQTSNQQLSDNATQIQLEQIQDMLNRIDLFAQNGAAQAAQELLSELQNLMDQLQETQQNMAESNGEPQEENSALNELLNQLGEVLDEQQALRDQTFEQSQKHTDAIQQKRNAQRQGDRKWLQENSDKNVEELGQRAKTEGELAIEKQLKKLTEQLSELKEEQDKLQQKLDNTVEGLNALGLETENGFGDASEAMGDASKRFSQKQFGSAIAEQGRAIEALRQGAQNLTEQMAQGQQNGNSAGSSQAGNQPFGQEGKDPLGRDLMTTDDTIPQESEVRRSREIQEEIRKRLEDKSRSAQEKRYLENLLKRK